MSKEVKDKVWLDVATCFNLAPNKYRDPAQRAIIRIPIKRDIDRALVNIEEFFAPHTFINGEKVNTFFASTYIKRQDGFYTVVYLVGEIVNKRVFIYHRIILDIRSQVGCKYLNRDRGYGCPVESIASYLSNIFPANRQVARFIRGGTSKDFKLFINKSLDLSDTIYQIQSKISDILLHYSDKGEGYTLIELSPKDLRILRVKTNGSAEKLFDIEIIQEVQE